MDHEFEVSEQPMLHTLSIRAFTSAEKLPEELGRAYHTIIEYLISIGESPSDAAFACYHNMDMQNLDVEMGLIVARALPEKDDIKPGEISEGKQLSYVHKGPYRELESVYKAMMQCGYSGASIHPRDWLASSTTTLLIKFSRANYLPRSYSH